MSNCRLISNEDILKIRGNDKLYSDAMESMIKFNKQLSSERKSRIPFLDQTTGIAQSNTNGMLWHDRSQRTYSNKTGQVFRYTAKNWFKNKRSLFDSSSSSLLSASSSSSSSVILNTDLNNNNINNSSQILNETSNSSNISISNQQQQQQQQQLVFVNIPQTVINKPIEQQQQQTINVHNTLITATDDWHEDNYDNFLNDENDSDYDEDDYKPKRTAIKKHAKHAKKAKTELGLDEKPYTCERCGAKYKTKPGLNYHVQKAHIATNNNNNNSSRNGNTSSLKINEIINTDENANSIFDTYGDDMNSSSSMPHTSAGY